MSFLGLVPLQKQQSETEGYFLGPNPELNNPNVNTQFNLGNPVSPSAEPLPYYPGATETPFLGLSLTNMGVNIAENLVIIDTFSTNVALLTGAQFTGAVTMDSLSIISNLTINGFITDSSGHVGAMGSLLINSCDDNTAVWGTSVPNLTITDTLTAATLAVTTAFSSPNLTVTGALTAGTFLGSSLDLIGSITMTNPATTQAYVFSTPFTDTDAPLVLLQATGADPTSLGGIWVTYQGGSGNWTGFTVNCHAAPGSTYTWDYFVVGSA
jgi:hypothetical protein